jgi:hypothetical protein
LPKDLEEVIFRYAPQDRMLELRNEVEDYFNRILEQSDFDTALQRVTEYVQQFERKMKAEAAAKRKATMLRIVVSTVASLLPTIAIVGLSLLL